MDISHEDQLLNQKKFLYALRNTPESVRCQDVLMYKPGSYCALGLGFHVLGFTDDEINKMDVEHAESYEPGMFYSNKFAELTGLPRAVVEGIVERNDRVDHEREGYDVKYIKPFSWNDIADFIEQWNGENNA